MTVNLDSRRKNPEVFAKNSDSYCMGMLDRYKKKGGFTQLLNLIETSGGRKQEQFLGLIAQESPAWEKELKLKILTVDRIFSWPSDVMSEVLSRLQPLTLCVSLIGKPQTEIDRILSPLPPITKKKLLDQMAELNPNPAEKSTCEMKLISEVRAISAAGLIKFEKFDADLFVEENVEDKIGSSDGGLAYLNKIEVSYSEDSKPSDAKAQHSTSVSPSNGGPESEVMKRKITQLTQENSTLKHENNVLKDKLNQIKRIA